MCVILTRYCISYVQSFWNVGFSYIFTEHINQFILSETSYVHTKHPVNTTNTIAKKSRQKKMLWLEIKTQDIAKVQRTTYVI